MSRMILDDILAVKKNEITRAKEELTLADVRAQALSFEYSPRSLSNALSDKSKISLIAEIKKASPSKGILRDNFNPVEIAKVYESSGCNALSILTDKEFFQGALSYIGDVHEAVSLPLLRKDFIIDEYQLYQSRLAYADAVLLIARILSKDELTRLIALSKELKLEVLCEVHDEQDIEKVLSTDAQIIGINNRNLKNFNLDLTQSVRLKKLIPDTKIVVSESGITSADDIAFLRDIGINAVLIGEVFMRSRDIALKVRELMKNG